VVLVRTEVARAMIFADKAVLFVGRWAARRAKQGPARPVLAIAWPAPPAT
jgi:hypothetical protein